ncbi:MAG: hypothetical protein NVSMB57_06660 [Actinomycetota bacterium]
MTTTIRAKITPSIAVALVVAGILIPSAGRTAEALRIGPKSGSKIEADFGPVAGVAAGGPKMIGNRCAPGLCDSLKLIVVLPSAERTFYATHNSLLSFHYSWTGAAPNDMDFFAVDPSGGQIGPGKPDTTDPGKNYEDLVISDPMPGVWTLYSVGAVTPVPTAAHLTGVLTHRKANPAAPFLRRFDDPGFATFDIPPGFQGKDALNRQNAGEPSLGVNPQTDAAMFISGTQVSRVTFNDSSSPPTAQWTDVTPANLKVISEDSVLFTDKRTGRTVVEELGLACNISSFTDDDGATWTPSEGCGPPQGWDHPAVGGGPFTQAGSGTTSYPDSVYNCSQYGVKDASCEISKDGGKTYGVPTFLFNGACSPIHGHIRVARDGSAYVPNGGCKQGHVGVAVSEDNNATWNVYTIPDSHAIGGVQDPSVDIGTNNVVYMGYVDADGHPKIATSRNHGKTWSRSIDVGRVSNIKGTEDGFPGGVRNAEFAEVIAGSKGRAAFAFLGTSTGGDTQSSAFRGTWYLFVSYTYDGGKHWQTINASPNNPIQRGCIWNGGGVSTCRNLLDFNDIAMDSHGRVLVAITDGCTTNDAYSCDRTNKIDDSGCGPGGLGASEVAGEFSTPTCTYGRHSAIVRQVCGRPLLAVYDKTFTSCGSHSRARSKRR